MDNDNVRKLAQELYSSGEKSFDETFTIPNSDEVVIVIAIRTNKRNGESIKELSEGIRRAVAGPYGQPCPMCRGSGKI